MSIIKLCVIGAGTASTASVLGMINALKSRKQQFQITCIHDPNSPTIQVGESTSTPILNLLTDVLNFRVLKDLPEVDGTLKYGVKYSGWGSKDFFVHHATPAIHLNSAKFSFWALKRFKEMYADCFQEIHDKIIDIKNHEDHAIAVGERASYVYDYIIDCRGFPTQREMNSDEYIIPQFTSVNSVIISPEFKKYNEMYTTSIAHRDGWMFGIPLEHRKAFGYLYNNNVTTYEEAIENFKKIKGLTDSDIEKTRKLSWTYFYKKKAIDKRVLISGNKLFFFEPSQGFPLHYYLVLADALIDCICSGRDVEASLNSFYKKVVEEVLDVIAFTYQANVDFDSKFWNYVKQASSEHLNNSPKFIEWRNNPTTNYASHSPEIMKYLIDGLEIDLNSI